jgi:hypothetical protein
MKINQESHTNQVYEILQAVGGVLTKQIEKAQFDGDEQKIAHLCLQKAELIKKLRGFVDVN